MKPFSAPSIHLLTVLVVVVHPPLILFLALFLASLRRHVRLMLPLIFLSASSAINAISVVSLAYVAHRQLMFFDSHCWNLLLILMIGFAADVGFAVEKLAEMAKPIPFK